MYYKLCLKTKFWQNPQKLGLFDYKDPSLKYSYPLYIQQPGIIYQNQQNNQLKFFKPEQIPQNGQIQSYLPLISFQCNQDKFKLTDIHSKLQPLSLIAPQNTTRQQGIIIQENSQLKLGKVKINILKLCLEGKKNISKKLQIPEVQIISQKNYHFQTIIQCRETTQKNIQSLHKSGETHNTDKKQLNTIEYSIYQENPSCRFCYSKSIQENNNFILLCNCEGFSKYIHERCLAQWLFMKGKFFTQRYGDNKQPMIYVASKQAFRCELCTKKYDVGKVLELLSRKFDDETKFRPLKIIKKYVVLEAETQNDSKIFIVNLDIQTKFKIGRLKDCDIFFQELSISRNHCQIQLIKQNGQQCLVVRDLSSKFGTIIKKSSIVFNKDKRIHLQKGCTYIEMHVQKCRQKFWSRIKAFCTPDLGQ